MYCKVLVSQNTLSRFDEISMVNEVNVVRYSNETAKKETKFETENIKNLKVFLPHVQNTPTKLKEVHTQSEISGDKTVKKENFDKKMINIIIGLFYAMVLIFITILILILILIWN